MLPLTWKRKSSELAVTMQLDTEGMNVIGYERENNEKYPILLVSYDS